MRRPWTAWLLLLLAAPLVSVAAHPLGTPDCTSGPLDALGCVRLDLARPEWSGAGPDVFAPGPFLAFAPDGGALYVVAQDRERPFWTGFSVFAMSPDDGQTLWVTSLGGSEGPALLEAVYDVRTAAGAVLVAGASETGLSIVALRPGDGEILWQTHLPMVGRPYEADGTIEVSPDGARVVVGGILVRLIPGGGEDDYRVEYDTRVTVLDTATGAIVWEETRHTAAWPADGTPQVAFAPDGASVYVVDQAWDSFSVAYVRVARLSTDDGTVLYEDRSLSDVDLATTEALRAVPLADGAHLAVVGDRLDTRRLGTPMVALFGPHGGPPVEHDASPYRALASVSSAEEQIVRAVPGPGTVLFLQGERLVWAFDAVTGEGLWEEAFHDGWSAAARGLAYDEGRGTVVTLSEGRIGDGTHAVLRLFDAASGDLRAETRFSDPAVDALRVVALTPTPRQDEHIVQVTSWPERSARLLFIALERIETPGVPA